MTATVQIINLGNVVNDGLGDDLRTAFQKVNANFSNLATAFNLTGQNTQVIGAKVYKEKIDNTLFFRNLIAGNKISITEFNDSIQINSTQPDAFVQINGNTGTYVADSINAAITIQGGNNINTTVNGQYLTIESNIDLDAVLLGFDFGPISNQYTSTIQVLAAAANVDFGTVLTPGPFNIDLGTI
jgi:hypothetical protein